MEEPLRRTCVTGRHIIVEEIVSEKSIPSSEEGGRGGQLIEVTLGRRARTGARMIGTPVKWDHYHPGKWSPSTEDNRKLTIFGEPLGSFWASVSGFSVDTIPNREIIGSGGNFHAIQRVDTFFIDFRGVHPLRTYRFV